MAIIIKSSIKLSKGFDTWQSMVKTQEERMKKMGIKFLFAGTEKNDPTQLHAIMMFPSMEVLQAFGSDEELTEIRRQAGAVIESGVMTPISEEYFTNYPDAFVQHQASNESTTLTLKARGPRRGALRFGGALAPIADEPSWFLTVTPI